MKIKMIETTNGAEDKINVKRYVKGEIYDISSVLKDIFLKMGVAEVHVEQKKAAVPENKMVKPKSDKEVEGKDDAKSARKKIKDLIK